MELTFDISRWGLFRRIHVCREDGSSAYTIRRLFLGTILLYNENGERVGSIDSRYNIHLGQNILIGKAECRKSLQMEWYQIHYYHFWTAEKIRGEDSYRVSMGQGEQIGSIREEYCGFLKYRYTLHGEDPKYFLMMLMLTLAIYIRHDYKTLK